MSRTTRAGLNKLIRSFHHFPTEAEALEYIRARRWRVYTLSSNQAGDCWTVYHKER